MRIILTDMDSEPPLALLVPTQEEKEATAEAIRETKELLRQHQTPEMPRRWVSLFRRN